MLDDYAYKVLHFDYDDIIKGKIKAGIIPALMNPFTYLLPHRVCSTCLSE
jgi:hypothetical protein